MTPQQKIKLLILLCAIDHDQFNIDEAITSENVDALYEKHEGDDFGLQDARAEVRCSGIKTDLPAPWSRHYECDAVAAQTPDGTWVGWNYWYGGGKRGNPDAVEWIEDAYDLSCTEKLVMATERTFTKVAQA